MHTTAAAAVAAAASLPTHPHPALEPPHHFALASAAFHAYASASASPSALGAQPPLGPFFKGAWRVYIGKRNHPSPPSAKGKGKDEAGHEQHPIVAKPPAVAAVVPVEEDGVDGSRQQPEQLQRRQRQPQRQQEGRGLRPLGWRLADDAMVDGPIRQEWFDVMGKLIREHRLARAKAQGFM
jgi:hypothetical protein